MSGAVRHIWGWVLVLLGIIGLIMPIMPGWIFLIPGLVILSDYLPWARRLLEWVKDKAGIHGGGGTPAAHRTRRGKVAEIPIGTVHEEGILVTGEVAVDFMGLEESRVLGTPHMIGHMERTCRNAVQPFWSRVSIRWGRTSTCTTWPPPPWACG